MLQITAYNALSAPGIKCPHLPADVIAMRARVTSQCLSGWCHEFRSYQELSTRVFGQAGRTKPVRVMIMA